MAISRRGRPFLLGERDREAGIVLKPVWTCSSSSSNHVGAPVFPSTQVLDETTESGVGQAIYIYQDKLTTKIQSLYFLHEKALGITLQATAAS